MTALVRASQRYTRVTLIDTGISSGYQGGGGEPEVIQQRQLPGRMMEGSGDEVVLKGQMRGHHVTCLNAYWKVIKTVNLYSVLPQ